jgi:hypothetical protein
MVRLSCSQQLIKTGLGAVTDSATTWNGWTLVHPSRLQRLVLLLLDRRSLALLGTTAAIIFLRAKRLTVNALHIFIIVAPANLTH